ncbi:MAG TPA: thermonuclease family protein [Shinella sp.]|jgi:endonuclease YncB( thermonuclease family)|uniref:thermonuclease family protein n=1 Tax=Shinella sp. TaxID=1870904 RepID=UPI002E157B82|nr:thermonuclease family protein [Shinella sp.]
MTFAKVVAISMMFAFASGATAMYLISGNIVPPANAVTQVSAKPFSRCAGAVRTHCVVDGDTLWLSGVKVRIADIDTPEISEPKCASEEALGEKATARLIELVNAGPFEMRAWQGRDEDRYGRKLRVLVRNGKSLGDVLVSESLAHTWSGRKEPWC